MSELYKDCFWSRGHDFRPTYRSLGQLRQRLSGVPFLAVTATATKEVKADISRVLNLQKPLTLQVYALPHRVPRDAQPVERCFLSTRHSTIY